MQRSLSIHPLALVGALALVVVLLLNATTKASSQFSTSSQSAGPGWPPKPENIVNIDSSQAVGSDLSGNLFFQPGTPFTLFTVPSDRWLVLTDLRVWKGGGNGNVSLQQLLGSAATAKVGPLSLLAGVSTDGFGESRTGIAFAPNSVVQLYTDANGVASLRFHFDGYLAPL